MSVRYDDGLDDFDREVLGHVPRRPRAIDTAAGLQRPPGYFPQFTSFHHSSPPDSYDVLCDFDSIPDSLIGQGNPQRAALSEQAQPSLNKSSMSCGPAESLRGAHSAPHNARSPLLSGFSGQASQTGHTSTNSFPALGSSSPTTRLSSLPDKFRAIFPFELFNAVQSKCFNVVYSTSDNVVVAAPTGSGKTAILELAICKLALDRGNENFKIVYQAPTKALCSEKARDWDKKFSHMNLKCAELTGDTSQSEMRRVGDASIIVTTPEKWDSITRKWQDHRSLLQMVELFLIDEVHILKDIRGATLEAVVSRMKTIGANVRFIALSATVPNSDDIAVWLGRNHTNQQLPAHRETFGEEFRPVKLQKFVYGFDCKGNDFIFDKFLDQKLPGLLYRHTRQKPILVFCFTRKSCETTAAMLAEYASGRPEGDKLWPVPSQRVPVLNRDLQEIVKFGVAFHHAGLDAQDRNTVEQHFLRGQLGIICCTSTLAVGINLPCHTVVLKGTVGFTDERLEEYSDLEVMQMLGRAGRPQFDDSATAIILTRAANKQRYEKMVSGQETLESTLHLNLIEHLNSEICLGTINDLSSAKTWLGGTFMSVRLRRNPDYYQLTGSTTSPSQIDARLEEICERDIRQLQEAELVTAQSMFRCTEYGRAMSKYMVEFNTMKMLLKIPRAVGMEALITILSQATEFKEFRLKPAERALFREINQSPLIMYPIKEAVNQTRHKVSLMIQSHLGCVQYPESGEAAKLKRQLMVEKKLIFERLNRLVRAVIDCKGHDRDSVGTKTALELARALAAESWEGRVTQLTQVPNIGPAGMRKLASKGIRTVLELADKGYDEIERLMSRQPPFGKNLQAHLDNFPRLDMDISVASYRRQPTSEEPVTVDVRATLRYLNRKGPPHWLKRIPALTFLAESGNGNLVYFWRGSMRKLDSQSGFELKFSVGLRNVHDRVVCHFSCEEIVGTIVTKTLEHDIPASAFPSRPISANPASGQRRKVDIQDYLDNDGIDDSDLMLAAEQALPHSTTIQGTMDTTCSGDDEYPSVEELLEVAGPGTQEANMRSSRHPAASHEREDEMDATQTIGREPINEGLDKPRKRVCPKPKRKREEEAADAIVGACIGRPKQSGAATPLARFPQATLREPDTQAKRQKLKTPPSFTQAKFVALSTKSVGIPKINWQDMDLDAMETDCIDLSLIDDEMDDTHNRKRDARLAPNSAESDVLGKTASKGGVSQEQLEKANKGEAKYLGSQAHKKAAPTVAPSSAQRDDYLDDDIFDETFTQELTTPNSTAAFKTGASDEALYEGICEKVTKAGVAGFPHKDALGTTDDTLAIVAELSSPTSSLFVDSTCSGMAADERPDRAAKTEGTQPPVSHGIKVGDDASDESRIKKGTKKDGEPDWVAEFDPEFVDMFRGYVTFV
ncbi:hypothetical protein VTK56DRAFT_574 [Thermocarpiscus australiensis]